MSDAIELRVTELTQLFNPMDASPFGQHRDLDPRVEEFITSWAREVNPRTPLALRIHLDRSPGSADEAASLEGEIHDYFHERELATRRRLKDLFRIGRISLLIGLGFLVLTEAISNLLSRMAQGGFAELMRAGLAIVGWVALWRPIEIFLYDWWPIRDQATLASRLAKMPVEIAYGSDRDPGAGRRDRAAHGATAGPMNRANG